MTTLEQAKNLIAEGFWLFPSKDKKTHIKGWPDLASNDLAQIEKWWGSGGTHKEWRISIFTGRYQKDRALTVVDVDKPDTAQAILDKNPNAFPATRSHSTPRGGVHGIYWTASPGIKSGANTLGPGIDIRSAGGLIHFGEGYSASSDGEEVAECPVWIIEKIGQAPADKPDRAVVTTPTVLINKDRAEDRVINYLKNGAPIAIEGLGGDTTTYKVAARCRSIGTNEATTLELMLAHWDPRCKPPWAEELAAKVKHAFKYAKGTQGDNAPESVFATLPAEVDPAVKDHPLEAINKNHALIKAGGFILWETTEKIEFLKLQNFKTNFKDRPFSIGKRMVTEADAWLEWSKRRNYDCLTFMPGQTAPERMYNLFRGWAVDPATPGTKHPGVDAWLEHGYENVCNGDDKLFRWLIGYCAQIIQKPWEKPLVALVFKGKKGVGKNGFIERMVDLIQPYGLVVSKKRYLTGQFNSHLERCLLLVLDEVFWAGEKDVDGITKDLVTGKNHVIERKGFEPYSVTNLTRSVIMGNEDWLVRATDDERRYTVFEVGTGRQGDTKFFQVMREDMENGGYPVLLRYLLDYDISDLDFNTAPVTEGLINQIDKTLPPIELWWQECLMAGSIVTGSFDGWPKDIRSDELRAACNRFMKEQNITGRRPDMKEFGKVLRKCCPKIRKYQGSEQGRPRYYNLPVLSIARKLFEQSIYKGRAIEWDDTDPRRGKEADTAGQVISGNACISELDAFN